MIDPKYIVENFDDVQKRLRLRDPSSNLGRIKDLYAERKRSTTQLNDLRAERNRLSRELASSHDPETLRTAEDVKRRITTLEVSARDAEKKLYAELVLLPNIPHETVPAMGVTVRETGRDPLGFEPKDHITLGKRLGLIDFERGTKMAAQKFAVYTDRGTELEYALQAYFLDCVRGRGFSVVITPLLANERAIFVSGQFPKFRDQVYATQDDLYLIPTVEVSLVALHLDETLDAKDFPVRYSSLTPNFRREAGAAGKRDQGLIRMHQYSAVEMVIFDAPEHSYLSLDEMVETAEAIVKNLGLPCRVVSLPAFDLAQQSAKTFDVEVFLPGQGGYYEVSSCSNCEEYQSRRGNIRFRDAEGRLRYVNTLNGTALATSRLFAAVLENYQQEDGSVIVPDGLRKYMRGMEIIEPR